ncbi:uncharacterized protein KZ484_008861 [Pholidichthys leucotaenia]
MEALHLGSLLLLNTGDERDDTGVVGGSLPAAMLPNGPAYGEEDDEAEPTLLTGRKSEKTTECVAAPSSEHQAEAGGRQESTQQNDSKQEEDVEDPRLLNQERNIILIQVERVPSQTKEEQEELCISQEGEQFGLKQETGTFNEGAPQQHDFNEEEFLIVQDKNSSLDQEKPDSTGIKEEEKECCRSREEEHFGPKQKTDIFMVTLTNLDSHDKETEPVSEQLLSHSFHETESKDQGAGKNVNPGSTKPEKPKSKKRLCRNRSHTNNVDNSPMPENQSHAAELPNFAYGDLYHYLIDKHSDYTKQKLKAFKNLDAYSYFVAGFVFDACVSKTREDIHMIMVKSR